MPSDPTATGIDDPPIAPAPGAADGGAWPALVAALESTVRAALPDHEPRATELAQRLASLASAVAADGARPEHVAAIADVCEQARRLLGQGHRLVLQLSQL